MIRFIFLYLERPPRARTGLLFVALKSSTYYYWVFWWRGLFWWQKLVSLGSSGRDASRFKCKCLLSTLFPTQSLRCVFHSLGKLSNLKRNLWRTEDCKNFLFVYLLQLCDVCWNWPLLVCHFYWDWFKGGKRHFKMYIYFGYNFTFHLPDMFETWLCMNNEV